MESRHVRLFCEQVPGLRDCRAALRAVFFWLGESSDDYRRSNVFAGGFSARWIICSVLAWCLSPASVFGQNAKPVLIGLAVRNSALEEHFRQSRDENEPVSKMLMDSNITGTQSTVTETRLRVLPDDARLSFELINTGQVSSQTTGVNRRAWIDSSGNHTFEVIKPLWFDGVRFLTKPCYGTIRASSTPQRVISTVGAAMPLLGPLSDRVAWNEVMRRQPEINRVLAEDVSQDVLPRVDRIADAEIAKLGRQWTQLRHQAHATLYHPGLHWSARSTGAVTAVWASADEDRIDQRIADAGGAIEDVPPSLCSMPEKSEILAVVSEQAVQPLLSSFVPGGLRLTDRQLQSLQALVADLNPDGGLSLNDLLAKLSAITIADEAPSLFTIEFAPKDPIQLHFADGDIRIDSTFQVHPPVGASSGWITTQLRLRGRRLNAEEWTIAVRGIDVGEPAAEETRLSRAETFAAGDEADAALPEFVIPNSNGQRNPQATTVQTGTAWSQIIRSAAETLTAATPTAKLPLEFDTQSILPTVPKLRLVGIESSGGLLRIALRTVP